MCPVNICVNPLAAVKMDEQKTQGVDKVTFPDMERVEWLNETIRRLWPYANQYIHDICKVTLEPKISKALKEYNLTDFCFKKIILGDTPVRLSGVKVYDDTSRHEIILDVDFAYAGDCEFEINLAMFDMGIKDVQISGKMRVVMKPLVRQFPLVGGLQVFFLNNPDIDFDLTGLANLLEMPGLRDILHCAVKEQIAEIMVLPNRIFAQLAKDISIAELKCPAPRGVMRINVIEAANLMDKDSVLGGKSDPVCILRLGAQKFRTEKVDNTCNPKWDYYCEFLVNDIRGQELNMTVFDVDKITDSDLLGRASLSMYDIWQNGEVDMWVPLSDASSGRIHVKASWLELLKDADSLEAQLEEIKCLQTTSTNLLHSAVLIVWIDSAKELNNIQDTLVRLHLDNNTQETSVRENTCNPVYEEGFTFLVRNPQMQELNVEMVDNKKDAVQSKIKVDLNKLLKECNLEIKNEEYLLSGVPGGKASLCMNLSLRILKTAQKPSNGDRTPENLGGTVEGDAASRGEGETTEIGKEEMTDKESTGIRQRMPEQGVHGLGRIQLTVEYGPQNNLVIVVHRILNLPLEGDGKLPDPYVKLQLLPDRSKDNSRETDVIENNCNPQYDQRFEYVLTPDELAKHTLEVTVINKKGLQCLPKIGQVLLDCGLLNTAKSTQWHDLCPPCGNEDN